MIARGWCILKENKYGKTTKICDTIKLNQQIGAEAITHPEFICLHIAQSYLALPQKTITIMPLECYAIFDSSYS